MLWNKVFELRDDIEKIAIDHDGKFIKSTNYAIGDFGLTQIKFIRAIYRLIHFIDFNSTDVFIVKNKYNTRVEPSNLLVIQILLNDIIANDQFTQNNFFKDILDLVSNDF